MIELGPIDQLPFLRLYTQILLCFPLTKGTDVPKVVATLQHATQALSKVFLYLQGQIIHEDDSQSTEPTSGVLKIIALTDFESSMFRVKHLNSEFPSYDEIRSAKAPFRMLDGEIIAPENARPKTNTDVAPVFIVQANFIRGGLILCFSAMHTALDGNSLGELIRMFATICRGEEISPSDISAGNLDRNAAFPSLYPGEKALTHENLRHDPIKIQPAPAPVHPQPIWTSFHLSRSSLTKIKDEASQNLPPATWISTDDALAALTWRAVTQARSSRLDLTSNSTFVRAINARRHCSPPLPASFIGNVVICANTTFPISSLLRASLPEISPLVRSATNEIDGHYLRTFVTLLRSVRDKRTIPHVSNHLDRDFLISSWTGLPIYGSDFGELLGKPEFVRKPRFAAAGGWAFFMPKDEEGGIDVVLGLREDDVERLREDRVWMKYAEFIG